MLHPHTRIQHISDDMGYGIFATKKIPAGAITYIKDALEIEISKALLENYTPRMREIIDKYSFTDGAGNHVLSWDLAKYVNHHCNANTLSTGYGFEIAIRDILPGEELTDDYGMFINKEFACSCDSPTCRKKLKPTDYETQSERWDSLVKPILKNIWMVEQPLFALIDDENRELLELFKLDSSKYLSVRKSRATQTNN